MIPSAISKPPAVFVSYRVADTADTVTELARTLRDDLGTEAVFRDRDSLIAGQPWQAGIDAAIDDADATVCLIGDSWVGDGDGARRIDASDDPVRLEVVRALGGETTPIPVITDGGSVPTDLSGELEALFEHHAIRAERAHLVDPTSSAYQSLLIGIWDAPDDGEVRCSCSPMSAIT